MGKPTKLNTNSVKRIPYKKSEEIENLISKEEYLRKLAYKNTPLKTDNTFFNDSDVNSDYYLIIIYEKKSFTPLLSARYYFSKPLIEKYLKGDNDGEPPIPLNLDKYNENEIMLIDRMSANYKCSVYRKNRNYIHHLFYAELLKQKKNCKIVAMARKERKEKLLAKYLGIGLKVIGTIKHNGKEHWVLIGDLGKSFSQLKIETFYNLLLILFFFLSRFKLNR